MESHHECSRIVVVVAEQPELPVSALESYHIYVISDWAGVRPRPKMLRLGLQVLKIATQVHLGFPVQAFEKKMNFVDPSMINVATK